MILNNGTVVNLITFGDNEDDDILIDDENINTYPVYKYIKKTRSPFLNFLSSFLIPFKLKEELKDGDLIKTNQLNGSWIGIILKFILKKPLIIRTGYNVYEFSKNERKSKIKQLFYFYLTKYSLKFSDKYLVSSNSDLVFLRENFSNTENVVVFPNWVDSLKYNDFKKMKLADLVYICRMQGSRKKNFFMFAAQHSLKIFDTVYFDVYTSFNTIFSYFIHRECQVINIEMMNSMTSKEFEKHISISLYEITIIFYFELYLCLSTG